VTDRKPRLRPLSSEVIENIAPNLTGTPEAELLDRLEEALSRLPAAERAAAVTAFGYGEGSPGVADELDLPAMEADALSRNALQLLRGALADLEPGNPDRYPRARPRSRSRRTDDD
jgi:DNA-directed RNA polymerase specialized sigma24 family protein